ncbi:MAG: imidazole glycerol phosphate synthase cyclase subunit [Cyclobacteriaceae bacterium]
MRVIGRLDIKNNYVIKGIQLEGLRKVGDPIELALKYYEQGADELIFMDAVASLYGRNNLFHIIEEACREIFVPIVIGGGIRNLSDIAMALKSGADKIAINTQAIRNPKIIEESVYQYGSQCIVGSIEAKRKGNSWEAYIENGREETNIDAIGWAATLEKLGIGEIMVTSIDKDGTKSGFDLDLVSSINKAVNIPVIACGGAGNMQHINDLIKSCNSDISAFSAASVLHYDLLSITDIKRDLGVF